jgi:hypothetical protein
MVKQGGDAAHTSHGDDLVSMLTNVVVGQLLPGQRYPGKMHLPGMNFAGPGTRLDKRLEPDSSSPKPDSLPVDRVDETTYHHDRAYNTFKDVKTRNQFDRVMLKEMAAINNPSLRERIERAVITLIINSKQKFGSGVGVLIKPRKTNQCEKCGLQIN